MVAIAALVSVSVVVAKAPQLAERTVTACLKTDQQFPPGIWPIIERAELIADRVFTGTGVKVNWYRNPRTCTAARNRAIQIDVASLTPSNELPGALALAQPFGGQYIRVFYDRIHRAVQPDVEPYLLGHVLAHEITHILQGTCQHAESGVMKARWDSGDYERMTQQPLRFTEADLQLIRIGLQKRLEAASQR